MTLYGNTPAVFFVDASKENTIAAWTEPPGRGWVPSFFERPQDATVAAGSSPATMTLYGNTPAVFFVDASKKNTIAAWVEPPGRGWVPAFFEGDAVAAGSSPIAMMTYGGLTVTTKTLAAGEVGASYSQTLTGIGGATPYTWSLIGGSLPPGLSLNATSGAITGTPTAGGTSSFTVEVTDSSTPTPQTATASLSITVGTHTQAIDSTNSLNAVSCVPSTTDCVASDSRGNALYATNVSATSSATWNAWSGPASTPSHAVACPTISLCLLADGEGSGGYMYYAKSLGGSWTQAFAPFFGVDAISCASESFCVEGQDNYGFFRYSANPASTTWNLGEQGSSAMTGVSCLSSSFCAMVDNGGSVHVATTSNMESTNESSGWTATDVDGSSALNGVACSSRTSCLAVDGAGNVLELAISGSGAATASKHNIDGTNNLTAIACATTSTCVTVDNQGNAFVSTNGGATWTKEYTFGDKLSGVSCASASLCVAVDTTGNVNTFRPY
jgi:hypothetical protein